MQRMTKQRKVILNCLEKSGRPLCIEEILAYTTGEIASINLSTIYRNLKELLQQGKITLINLPGEKVCYELVKNTHHHYFLCNECNKIFVIEGCPKGILEIVPAGFQMHGHSVTLNGFCRECSL